MERPRKSKNYNLSLHKRGSESRHSIRTIHTILNRKIMAAAKPRGICAQAIMELSRDVGASQRTQNKQA